MKIFLKEEKLSDLITVRLHPDGKTFIFVNDTLFQQCSYILLNINPINRDEINQIDSIDDLVPYDRAKEFKDKISPEESFMAHCSNLQAWIENDYDTRILHSNLSFPLLKKLSDNGDQKARRMFKDEVAKRYNAGNETVRKYLKKEYLKKEIFTTEELCEIDLEYQNEIKQEQEFMQKMRVLKSSSNFSDFVDFSRSQLYENIQGSSVHISVYDAYKIELRFLSEIYTIAINSTFSCGECNKGRLNILNMIFNAYRGLRTEFGWVTIIEMINDSSRYYCTACQKRYKVRGIRSFDDLTNKELQKRTSFLIKILSQDKEEKNNRVRNTFVISFIYLLFVIAIIAIGFFTL